MEDERWLTMAVLDHLQKVSKRGDIKEEPVQEAIFALSNAYSLNMHNSATKERYPLNGLSLPEVFRVGRAKLLEYRLNGPREPVPPSHTADEVGADMTSVMEKDVVFQKFLARLRETTSFFKDVEPGTAEYNRRASRAWEKYQVKRHTKRQAKRKQHENPVTGGAASSSASREVPADVTASKTTSKADSAEAARLKEEGNVALKAKDYQKAHDLYTRSIELDGSNAVFYSNRAAAKLHLSLFTEAVEDCKKAIALDPNFVRPHERLAASYRCLGMTQNEIDALKGGLEVAPHNQAFLMQLRDAEGRLAGGVGRGVGGSGDGGGGGSGDGRDALQGLLGATNAGSVSDVARGFGLNLPEGVLDNFLGSGNMGQLGSFMRENPAMMQQAMQAMMGGMGGENSADGGGLGGGQG